MHRTEHMPYRHGHKNEQTTNVETNHANQLSAQVLHVFCTVTCSKYLLICSVSLRLPGWQPLVHLVGLSTTRLTGNNSTEREVRHRGKVNRNVEPTWPASYNYDYCFQCTGETSALRELYNNVLYRSTYIHTRWVIITGTPTKSGISSLLGHIYGYNLAWLSPR